jgi:hypothetical protein
MMFDKKKVAQTVIAKMDHEPKKMAEGGAVENDDHAFAGLHAAMEDMMDAISRKHPQDMHKALSAYLGLHKQLEPGEPPSNEASDNEAGHESSQMHYGWQR